MAARKIALLSNITADFIGEQLTDKYDVFIPAGYNAWISEVLGEDSQLYQIDHDAVIVLLDGSCEGVWDDQKEAINLLEVWGRAVEELVDRLTDIPVIVSTLDIRGDRICALSETDASINLQNYWLQKLSLFRKEHNNLFLIRLSEIIAENGRTNMYSRKLWYMANEPYSVKGVKIIASKIDEILQAIFEPRKKLIVLDLDNTLWGGIAGEEGIDGICLARHKEGARYYDFQCRLLKMKQNGVLLAVCSKNNPNDVLDIIEKHPDMVLHKDDFVAMEINWEEKTVNIRHIAEQLNLTEGSIIFIDDNPMEREQMKNCFPQILVPDFPQDTAELPDFADALYEQYIQPAYILEEDIRKTEMYHAQESRRIERESSNDLKGYLIKLEMKVNIHVMQPYELQRVVQLCQKTNQFNLTTKRYVQKDIEQIAKEETAKIFVSNVEDKYGKEGVVSVVITRLNGKEVILDTFLMSCRVMGRRIEDLIMGEILQYYGKYADRAMGRFIRTHKNVPVENFYETQGFELIKEGAMEKVYEKNIRDYTYERPSIYKQVIFHV